MVCLTCSWLLAGRPEVSAPLAVIGAVTSVAVSFRIRALDDIKDAAVDQLRNPERPVPRGAVAESDLWRAVVALITLEAVLNVLAGPGRFAAWLAVLVFTLLMFKDFFVQAWITRRPWLYVLSHTFVVPLLAFYLVTCIDPALAGRQPGPVSALLGVAFLAGFAGNVVRLKKKGTL